MNKNIYRQSDSRWGKLPYPTKSYSFSGNGCGCCACLHVLIEQDKYKNWTPKDLRPYMVNQGFATKGNGTTWNGIKRTLEHYGNTVINHSTMDSIFKTLDERKKKGLPRLGVILFRSGSKGGVVWTAGGHYVAFVDYKVSNGKHYFYTKDSGGRHHDGWYCYETTMKGLIPQIWSAIPKNAAAPKPANNTTTTTTTTTPKVEMVGYTGKFPNETLKKGSKGTQVKYLQKFLNWYGNYKLTVDGQFGAKTLAAVKDFQKKEGLTVDGIVGIKTRNKMQAIKKKKVINTQTTTTTTTTSTSTKVKIKGMDISVWQGKIDKANFEKAKKAGINFVILRVGYTGSSTKKPTDDSVFEHNYANAIAAGLPVGIYYYSLATTADKAKTEANYVIKKLKDKKITYPVYIDMEDPNYQGKCSAGTLASVCNAFCNTIAAAGYKPGVYASLNWFNNKIGNISAPHTKWVAQYNKTCDYKGAYDMWQYSSSEAVPGIGNKIDVNWCYKKFSEPKTETPTPTPAPTPTPTPAPTPVPEPAPVVTEKKSYSGTLPSMKLVKSNAQVIADTIRWAKWIAGDNRFHYGYTNKHGSSDSSKWNPNAHHNGCYFCHTNVTSGGRSKKGIVDYQFTYCCNPFVGAAWAHGGCVPKALSLCKDGTSWDYHKGKGYDSSSLFTNLGHPAKSKLKPGDVLCRDTHVALYIGDGKIVEAGAGDDNVRNSEKWNNSIRVKTLTDENYKNFPRVHRFNSSVNTEAYIYHGEVSTRVSQWQTFLDWWFDGKVGSADGIYGDNTLKWTKKFQEEQIGKGQGDGVIGPKTIEVAKKCEK